MPPKVQTEFSKLHEATKRVARILGPLTQEERDKVVAAARALLGEAKA